MTHSLQSRFVLWASLLTACTPLLAQPDSLTVQDTIHLSKRHYGLSTVREYGYYYANHLADAQVVPLLRLSPDPTVQRLVRRGRLVRSIGTGMTAVSMSALTAGILTPRRYYETGGALLLTGLGLFYGALIPLGQGKRQFQRAVTAQNQFLRRRVDDYYAPVVRSPTLLAEPTLADTVAIRRRGLGHQFVYRSIRVAPARQLQRLADRLDDAELKQGMQYTRRVSALAGIIGGLGSTGLSSSLLFYGVQRTNGNAARLGTTLFWGSLTALTFSYGLRLNVEGVQVRTVRLLNERLRSQ